MKTDKRLLGTWQSDGRPTVREWRFPKGLTPAQRKRILQLFGKLRLTYTRQRIRGRLGDYRYTQPYEVVATDSDTVAIRYREQITGEWRVQHIHFEGDRYWIALGYNREWFKRVGKRGGNHLSRRRGAAKQRNAVQTGTPDESAHARQQR